MAERIYREVQGRITLRSGHPFPGGVEKPVHSQHRGRDPPPLQVDRVEHTARRAGPSVAEGGDNRIDPCDQVIDDLRWRGVPDEHLLGEVDFREIVLVVQQLRDVPEEPIPAGLVVPEEAEPFVGERLQALRRNDHARAGSLPWVEKRHAHGLLLVGPALKAPRKARSARSREWYSRIV